MTSSVRLMARGKEKKNSRQNFKVYVLAVCIGILSALLINFFNDNCSREMSNLKKELPKYWSVCLRNWNKRGNLRSINRVFDRLGFEAVNVSLTENNDWDVLWSIECPFDPKHIQDFNLVYDELKPHQRINHFPGINFITSKWFMTTNNRNIKNILPGFRFPNDIEAFQAFIEQNPNSKFVEKSLYNRGVKLIEKSEIMFNLSNKFYQVFLEKPFLVEGRLMDFSVFVVIASIDPLRIYRFNQDAHLRFCTEPYEPFDPLDLNKYVVADSHHILLDLPQMNKIYETFGFSFKQIIEEVFKSKGHNVTDLWRKIDETIVELIVKNEKNFIEQTFNLFKTSFHFFELVRFDFLLNENLDPYLLEVNMSPGMTPISETAQRMSQTQEQIIYDTLRLVGCGSKLDLLSGYDLKDDEMISNSKNIAVDLETCINHNCDQNCDAEECHLCLNCLDNLNLRNMHRAHREHRNRGGFKRIFPTEGFLKKDLQMTMHNNISIKWFKKKCEEMSDWC